jgi:hypothetical protein
MSCNCSPEDKRTYYANIQLFSEQQSGLVAGASPLSVKMREVVVCAKCGTGEFLVPTSELPWLRSCWGKIKSPGASRSFGLR